MNRLVSYGDQLVSGRTGTQASVDACIGPRGFPVQKTGIGICYTLYPIYYIILLFDIYDLFTEHFLYGLCRVSFSVSTSNTSDSRSAR